MSGEPGRSGVAGTSAEPGGSLDLRIPECEGCGLAVWPPRLLCPRCHCDRWGEREAAHGTLEEACELESSGVTFGTVRLDAGPVVVVRCEGAQPGDGVHLTLEDGALTARRRSGSELPDNS
ncbi:MAG: zinc ribbon domain-containing protein [Solirubrobacteraceae bacterium]